MMRFKIIAIGTGIILLLMTLLSLAYRKIEKVKAENSRLERNQDILLSENESYKTKDSLNVLSIKELTFTNKELKKYAAEDLELIKSLRVDNKRLSKISTSQIETRYVFKTVFKDSILYQNSIPTDTFKTISYKDPWMELDAVVDSFGTLNGSIKTIDSLVYIEHIEPKRFLFFKWGIKNRKQEIVSKNPNTRIVSAKFISIKDR